MWIEDTTACDGCGNEVTLYTDGRLGYAITSPQERDTGEDDIWREGFALLVACPVCRTHVTFTGEGIHIPGRTDQVEDFALPILNDEP